MKEYARKFLKFLFFFLDFTCGTLLLSAIANSERCKETKKKKKKALGHVYSGLFHASSEKKMPK